MKSINLNPSNFKILILQVLHFNDFSKVTSEADSHYSFSEISPNFSFHKDLPCNIRFGYKPRYNQAAQLVMLFEVYGGNFKKNGTRLVELNCKKDLEVALANLVQPIFPAMHFQTLADEAHIVFSAMLQDITSHEIDFNDWLMSMDEIGGKSHVLPHHDKPDELVFAQVSATNPELDLLQLDAIGLCEVDSDIKHPFLLQKLDTIYKLNNAPQIGSYLSTEISDLLYRLHKNTIVCEY